MKKSIISVFLLTIMSLSMFAGGEYGRIASITSVQMKTDNSFNTSYRVGIKNNSSKTITSFEVSYYFKNPFTRFDIAETEHFVKIHQIAVNPGQVSSTSYFSLSPNNSNYQLYGVYIKAVRFSDGSVIRRSSNQGSNEQYFGDYYL